ncbi:hypothetical protein ACFL2J_03315 [Candidatus Omnitrophota bacterium]
MLNKRFILITLVVTLCVVKLISAETIIFKSGKRIKGKIIEETDEYVRIEYNGLPLTYYREEIKRIEELLVVPDNDLQEVASKFLSRGASGQESEALESEIVPAETEEYELEIIRLDIERITAEREAESGISTAGGILDEKNWIKNHHGVIFYQDYSSDSYDFAELVKMAKKLGTNMVRTWITGDNPGEIPGKVGSSTYRNIFDSFRVIALNVCQDYLKYRWDQGAGYDSRTKRDVQFDFYQLTKFLIDNYDGQGKTFIISYFFEVNLYMGTVFSGRPDFPVVQFVSDAQRGVKKAIAEAQIRDIVILDCFETNSDHDIFNFVKNIFPDIHVDLYSISFYSFDSVKSKLAYLAKYAPDNDLFGSKNVMVGEYGIRMEDTRINGNEEAQSKYLSNVRKEAKEWGVPYMFLFWLADQESKIDSEGHFGLVDLQGKECKAWEDLYTSYR